MKDLNVFQIGLLAGFALLALLGLFFFANFSGGGNDTPAGTVLIWGSVPKDVVEAGIQELVADDADYSDITYVEVPAASFSRELADALAEGTGPDLVLLSQEELVAERGKLMLIPYESLSQRDFIDSFVPEFELYLSTGGSYGVPLVLDPLVLYYNRALLSSAGIVSAPNTWEAVAGLADAVVERDQAGVLSQSLVPFGSYNNVTNARAILSLLLLQSGTPITSEDERGVSSQLSEEGTSGKAVTESAVRYYAEFADPAKLVYSWNQALPSSRVAFLTGDLALYPGYASELGALQAAAPNLDFDMARIPQPGTASLRTTYGKAYALAITRASTNPTGALQVAFALSSGKPAVAVASTYGAAPARRVLLTPPAEDRFAAVYYPEALVARGWLSPAPANVDAIFSAMIGNMTTGRQTAAGALEAASQALDAALR